MGATRRGGRAGGQASDGRGAPDGLRPLGVRLVRVGTRVRDRVRDRARDTLLLTLTVSLNLTLTLTRYAAAIEYAIGQQPGGRAWADDVGVAPQVGARGRGKCGVRGRGLALTLTLTPTRCPTLTLTPCRMVRV